jgi:hypothetical protein
MINPTVQRQTLKRSLPRLIAALILAVGFVFGAPIMLGYGPHTNEVSLTR